MNETKYLEKIDEIILDVIFHYGTISLLDLWYELGESCELKEQPVTADGVLSRLEFLSTNGFIKSEGGEWGYFRAKLSSCKSINVMLKRNAIISFTTKKVSGTCDLVSTTYANLVADVKKDENLLVELFDY